jgi:hypothetical protein
MKIIFLDEWMDEQSIYRMIRVRFSHERKKLLIFICLKIREMKTHSVDSINLRE